MAPFRALLLFLLVPPVAALFTLTEASAQEPFPDGTRPTITIPGFQAAQDLRIIVYGDMRFTTLYNQRDTWPGVRKWLANKVAAEHPDALLVTGDIPFHGSLTGDWDVFRQETASWRDAQLRVFPTIGNHEVLPFFDSGYQNYFAAFPALQGHRAYSVLIGNVFIMSVNNVEALWPKSPQLDWFSSQLDHIPDQADFVFILIHIPLIADVQSEFLVDIPSPDLAKFRGYLEGRASTIRQKIIVASGHIHNYERFEEKGITHIISGGGGARPYPVYLPGPEDLYHDHDFPNFHYVLFHFHGRHAEGTMYRVKDPKADPNASSFSVEVKDRFTLDAPASTHSADLDPIRK